MRIYDSVLTILVCALLLCSAEAKVIHVPADQPTIQAGINAAVNGDTVLVSPGTYVENINFNGKAITVKGSNGPSVTTIKGNPGAVTVTFNNGEGTASVLQGFTISGGGISYTTGVNIISASPSIIGNKIIDNHWCDGAGISVNWGSPIIKGNTITNNFHDLCSGGTGGAGISITGQGTAQIIGNVISSNNAGNGFAGGGISLWAAGAPVLMNNTFSNNTIQTQGGAIGIEACCSNAVIVQNLVIGNSAPQGGGIAYSTDSGAPVIVNNTLVGNQSSNGMGSGMYFFSYSSSPIALFNNVISVPTGQTAVYCVNTVPAFTSNDVYAPQGTGYSGLCTDQTGLNGNISANPLFVNNGNSRLKGGSPAIDAGDNSAPNLPTKDFAGNPRIVNGNDGPTAIVDMGAYEFIPVVLTPTTLGFGTHPIGTHTPKTVKLTNNLNKTLSITSIATTGDYSYSSACGSSVPPKTSCNITVTFTPTMKGSRPGTLTVNDVSGNSPQTVKLSGTGQ